MITRFEQAPGTRELGIEWEGIRRVIVGVVPDGVTEVTIEADTIRRVPVEGNAYVARVGDGTARISWGGGHVIWPE